MNIRFISCFLFLLSSTLCSYSQQEGDMYTFDYVKTNGMDNPEVCIAILDSIVKRDFPNNYNDLDPKYYYLYGMMYNYSLNFYMSNKYLLKTLDTKLIDTNSKVKFNVYWKFADNYNRIGNSDKAVIHAIKALEVANNSIDKYYGFMVLGDIYLLMSNPNEAVKYYEKAKDVVDDDIYKSQIDIRIGNVYVSYADFEEGLKYYDEGYNRLCSITSQHVEGTQYEDTISLDVLKSEFLADLAYANYKNGNKSKARTQADEACGILDKYGFYDYGTPNQMLALFYLGDGQYQKALDRSLPSLESNICDTIYSEYYNNLLNIAEAYVGLGDYKKGYNYARRAITVNYEIERRNDMNLASEIATAYETAEKELQIEQHQRKITEYRLWALILLISLLLVLGIVIINIFYTRRIKIKNRALYLQIKDLSIKEQELDKIKQNLVSEIKETTTDINFEIANNIIRNNKNYLNPEYGRAELCKEIGTNEKYIYNVIKEAIGVTPQTYITKLRVEYAKNILLSNNKKSIADIAVESGFSNVRTFNRQFYNEIGLTPTEFHKMIVS